MRKSGGSPTGEAAVASGGLPFAQRAGGGSATERAAENPTSDAHGQVSGSELPPCAGVADPDTPTWLCYMCAGALCRRKPSMPLYAVANWNWGGRLHPLYTDLSIAMQTLLELAILVCRMMLLRYTDTPEEQARGFTGNTILLAQPTPQPPPQVMDTLHTVTPNLERPASMRSATCQMPTSDQQNPAIVDDNDADAAAEVDMDAGDGTAASEHGAGAPGRSAEEALLLVDGPAEFLIGVQECDSHDPVDRMVAFQKSLELVHTVGTRMHALAISWNLF